MIRIVFTCAMVMGLMACSANHNSIYRNFDVEKGQSAMVDIRQRAVLVAPYEKKSLDEHNKPVTEKGAFVCAEPSPDAMAALAYELAVKGDVAKKGNVEISHAMNDSAAFTGLRTQSIQLLRDFGYRLCESRMSGAITDAQYDLLMRRFQKNTVALLAIEQLTGALKVPPVALTSSGKAEAAKALGEQRAEREKIGDHLADLEKEKATLETDMSAIKTEKETKEAKKKLLDTDKNADTKALDADIKALGEKFKELDDKHKAADAKATRLKGDLKVVDDAIANMKGVIAEGRTDVTIKTDVVSGQRSDEHIQKVADVVKEIVNNIVLSDDDEQICLSFLQSEQAHLSSDFGRLCVAMLENRENDNKQYVIGLVKSIDVIQKEIDSASASQIPALRKELQQVVKELKGAAQGNGLYQLNLDR